MRYSTSVLMLACALGASVLGACGSMTESVPGVSVTIDEIEISSGSRSIRYRYTVQNASRDSVWVAACDGVIRPDVAVMVRGRRTDSYSGSLCTANVYMGPALLAPGGQQSGGGEVQSVPGASFVPSVTVWRGPTAAGTARTVQGGAFGGS